MNAIDVRCPSHPPPPPMHIHISPPQFLLPPLVSEDFPSFLDSVSLSPTNPRQCVNISITDDAILEVDEYFAVNLTSVGMLPPRTTLDPAGARVRINDNDCKWCSFSMQAYRLCYHGTT